MKGLILILWLLLTFEYIHGALIGYELQSPEIFGTTLSPKSEPAENFDQNQDFSDQQMVHPMMVYKHIKVRHKPEKRIKVKSTFKIWFKKFKIFLEDLA